MGNVNQGVDDRVNRLSCVKSVSRGMSPKYLCRTVSTDHKNIRRRK